MYNNHVTSAQHSFGSQDQYTPHASSAHNAPLHKPNVIIGSDIRNTS